MSESLVLYLDIPTFINNHASWVSEESPLRIRSRKWRSRWGVELSIRKGNLRRQAVRIVASQAEAAAVSAEMRTRFKRILHHVA